MSTYVEHYIIYGFKFGEEFTREYWKKDFRGEMGWNKTKPSHQPYFLTDGMNGEYTFFGFITELSDGRSCPQEKEINMSFTKAQIISKIVELYPDIEVSDEDVKMFYLPLWV